MRQRAAICRALITDPDLLLMDEPFGAVDALTRDQLNVELQSIWLRSKKTVLFVTHSIPEAIFLADRVAVMASRPGRIVETVAIEFPRPRPLDVRDEPGFAQLSRQIRRILESHGAFTRE
jgi:NitT/TauT family transport system ATP-binding protein